ncbi:hypothetical protein QJQ45_020945, partial [Haematococcus lacustris]
PLFLDVYDSKRTRLRGGSFRFHDRDVCSRAGAAPTELSSWPSRAKPKETRPRMEDEKGKHVPSGPRLFRVAQLAIAQWKRAHSGDSGAGQAGEPACLGARQLLVWYRTAQREVAEQHTPSSELGNDSSSSCGSDSSSSSDDEEVPTLAVAIIGTLPAVAGIGAAAGGVATGTQLLDQQSANGSAANDTLPILVAVRLLACCHKVHGQQVAVQPLACSSQVCVQQAVAVRLLACCHKVHGQQVVVQPLACSSQVCAQQAVAVQPLACCHKVHGQQVVVQPLACSSQVCVQQAVAVRLLACCHKEHGQQVAVQPLACSSQVWVQQAVAVRLLACCHKVHGQQVVVQPLACSSQVCAQQAVAVQPLACCHKVHGQQVPVQPLACSSQVCVQQAVAMRLLACCHKVHGQQVVVQPLACSSQVCVQQAVAVRLLACCHKVHGQQVPVQPPCQRGAAELRVGVEVGWQQLWHLLSSSLPHLTALLIDHCRAQH